MKIRLLELILLGMKKKSELLVAGDSWEQTAKMKSTLISRGILTLRMSCCAFCRL